jgi:anaerobic magnesium-protoporphyrin IX monomethyl ester cyclase
VQFLDAILFPNPRWLREFAPLYKKCIGLPFSANLRADFVTEETAGILADMGCRVTRFGVESGDEHMTREILNRGLDVEDIRRAFAILEKRGIERWSYNIVGLPEETLPMALKTIRLNAEIKPDLALAFIFYPYPGTALYDLCAEKGYLTDKELDHYFQGVTTRYPDFSTGDILFLHRFFTSLMGVYAMANDWSDKDRRRWWRLVDSILASPLLPRKALVWLHDKYRDLRTRIGGLLVDRSPALYRFLGGTDPV